MGDLKFNYNSIRSAKARISAVFSNVWHIALGSLAIILIAAGTGFLVLGNSIGWALLGLAFAPAMVIEWYNGELRHLAVSKNIKSIDDVLSAEVLGRLSRSPTPIEIVNVVYGLGGGQFFFARFGLRQDFVEGMVSDSVGDMPSVWAEAMRLRDLTGSKNISAVVLLAALLNCNPNSAVLISHLQLDLDDLVDGILWLNHLRALIEDNRKPKLTGGVARDWSFGWTPLLSRFGQNVSQTIEGAAMMNLPSHDQAIEQMINILSKNGKQNVVLVGESGVGKTRIVHSFASRLVDGKSKLPSNLKYRQVFILDAVALIAAAPERGGLEKLIPQIMDEAYKAKNIIICLDNAHLFFEEAVGSVDISNVLLPLLESSSLRLILAVDEQRFLQISSRKPEIANTLNQIIVTPASRKETIAIMQDRAVLIEYQNSVTYMYQALVESYRLGDRYVFDLAMPGKGLKLMEAAAQYSMDGVVTAQSVQNSIEKTLGIKVSVATGDDERKKLLNMEVLIHKRMINQTRAVSVVSDALRRARAGVRSQNRPIGTFLFLGPTGVGKTELAKSLAEVYFGGEDRMIRLDMNEYVGSDDVGRLLADGADNTYSLTARVMKQPFSVVLLDEIEKAHPNVLSTLLQLLDEGILRDVKNREVSFRDAIVIATSNAGADRIREHIDRGIDIVKYEKHFVDELISSNQFRPEFLNRFDEIVMFRPLDKPELLQVVDLMIAGVNKTLALQKVSVNVALDAKEYLVEHGYDPRLGARPMRRVVQKAVENTVAKKMLEGNVEPGSVVEISLEQVQQALGSLPKTAN
ncbi:MAG: ATP-dependent Clp protease ATP-binding subunit [Candidatus Saccharibacteria bacterium]